jgi:drug/metabolite transporter (DMT)-like permease
VSADAAARLRGFGLTAAGVAILSLDAALIRLIDAPAATVGLWRGVLQAAALLALRLLWRAPAPRLSALGPILGGGALLAGSALSFIGAITWAPAPHVLLIVSMAPLGGALVAWLTLGEPVARATWAAIAVATAGLWFALSDGAASAHVGTEPPFPFAGHLLAGCAVLSISGYFTLLRSRRAPAGLDAVIVGGCFMALFSAPLAGQWALPPASIPFALALGALVIPASFALITAGARLLPSAEAGLVLLLETVLGVVWVWLFLGEAPSDRALLGGAAVLAALAGRVVALSRR